MEMLTAMIVIVLKCTHKYLCDVAHEVGVALCVSRFVFIGVFNRDL